MAPWPAWLEPDNEVVNDKLDWVLRQRYANYDPQPTIPSTIELECKTNPYLRCNEAKMMSRLGVSPDVEAKPDEDTLTRLTREADVLNKLLKLKKDTLSYSQLPVGLPRSYADGRAIAEKNCAILNTGIKRVKMIATHSNPLETWREKVGITPRDFHEDEDEKALQEAILRSIEVSVGEEASSPTGNVETSSKKEIPTLVQTKSLIDENYEQAMGDSIDTSLTVDQEEIVIAMEEVPTHSDADDAAQGPQP